MQAGNWLGFAVARFVVPVFRKDPTVNFLHLIIKIYLMLNCWGRSLLAHIVYGSFLYTIVASLVVGRALHEEDESPIQIQAGAPHTGDIGGNIIIIYYGPMNVDLWFFIGFGSTILIQENGSYLIPSCESISLTTETTTKN
ncbi:hypothetical protein ACJX0J_016194, partial [Zea mays]